MTEEIIEAFSYILFFPRCEDAKLLINENVHTRRHAYERQGEASWHVEFVMHVSKTVPLIIIIILILMIIIMKENIPRCR